MKLQGESKQSAATLESWPSKGKEYVMRDGDVVHFRFNV